MAATFPGVACVTSSADSRILYSAEPTAAASGFRAYIAKDNPRKRCSEQAQKEEDAGVHSSGSDRTASVELHGSGKVGTSAWKRPYIPAPPWLTPDPATEADCYHATAEAPGGTAGRTTYLTGGRL